MIWILLAYGVLGLWCAFRLVPWGQRHFFVARYRSDTWHAKLAGAVVVALLVSALWPFYAWIWWRQGPIQETVQHTELELEEARQRVREFLGEGYGDR